MTKITSLDLAPFYRNTIGMDRLFDRIVSQFDHATQTNYPPYDIVKTGDDSYEIRVAVAGFAQGEVDVYCMLTDRVYGTQKRTRLTTVGKE